MNVTEINGIFHCDCGFSWAKGESGSHNCADGWREKLWQLAAENVALKKSAPAPFSKLMMEALDTYHSKADDVPELAMLSAYVKLRDGLKTPATDRILAEAEARGVEKAIECIVQTITPNHETILKELSQQLREGADK
ncbi:Uncharacterised protein [Klebsiella pneumoniae]|nr:Uncharacterised protein [Klebsiella pneumoniae]